MRKKIKNLFQRIKNNKKCKKEGEYDDRVKT